MTPEQAHLISLPNLDGGATPQESLRLTSNPLLDVKAHLQVCVGEAVMTVGELLDAKLHQIVALDRAVDDVVDVLLEGRVVARGQLVAVGDCFGVRLTELPLPLKP